MDSTTATADMTAPPVAGQWASVNEGVVRRRILGAATALCATAPLGLAMYLPPSDRGLGTHEQLGLQPCGWITLMDLPCPTCGMTTAFSHAAHGDLLSSMAAQPLGFILATITAMAVIIGGYVAFTGSRVGSMFTRLWFRSAGWWVAGAVLVAWVYKIMSYKGML